MCGRMADRVVTGQDSAVTIRRELLKDGNYAVKGRQSFQRTSMVMVHVLSLSQVDRVVTGRDCFVTWQTELTGRDWFCHMLNRVVTGRDVAVTWWIEVSQDGNGIWPSGVVTVQVYRTGNGAFT
jgi:hypothetical protein